MASILAAALLAAQAAVPLVTTPQPVPLTIEQQSAVRCSIAIAMAAEQQRAGQAAGKTWPDLTTRGREFFVRSLARLMDEAKLTRSMLTLYAQREAEALKQPGRLDEVMPPCLMFLEVSGL